MKLYFGRDTQKANISIDLVEENLHFVLLVGDEDSGKTFFHRSLYHDLILDETPSTLRFFFYDVAGLDTEEWLHSRFLYAPLTSDPEIALETLERIADEAERRRFPIPGAFTTIVIHIEESDLVRVDRQRLEKIFEKILAHKKTSSIFIFYSTSTVDETYLKDWIKKFVDLRVVFRIADRRKAKLVSGSELPSLLTQPGEHLILFKNRKIRSAPFQKISSIL